jgi:hypothetical protein
VNDRLLLRRQRQSIHHRSVRSDLSPDSSLLFASGNALRGHTFNAIAIHHHAPLGAPQTRLTVNTPGDVYEQEADRVATQVLRMSDEEVLTACAGEGIQRLTSEEEEEELLQAKEESGATPQVLAARAGEGIQRLTSEEEEEELLQAKEESGATPQVTPETQAAIDAMRGGGAPLDPTTRAFMEPRFGHDFSRVRVHTDARAATVARSLDALAFTVGDDIAFAPGQYRPGSDEGRALLAHELTHTIQQTGGATRVQRQEAGAERAASSGNTTIEALSDCECGNQ